MCKLSLHCGTLVHRVGLLEADGPCSLVIWKAICTWDLRQVLPVAVVAVVVCGPCSHDQYTNARNAQINAKTNLQ